MITNLLLHTAKKKLKIEVMTLDDCNLRKGTFYDRLEKNR